MECLRVDDFDYHLPEQLIAQTPLDKRDESRLLVVDPVRKQFVHTQFNAIIRHLQPGDVLVLNNSKVFPARLRGVKRDTGGRVELLLLHPMEHAHRYLALARPAKRLQLGHVITFGEGREQVFARVVGVQDEGIREIEFLSDESVYDIAERLGEMPLPPYIHEELTDRNRYQTVYAQPIGSVAAPTAGLHFTDELLEHIRRCKVEVQTVTLHVGLGTFRPVQVETVEDHPMHSEWYEITPETAAIVNRAKRDGRRVIAVGTTALRTLESAGQTGCVQAESKETDIFIYPGYEFRVADGLITNFHLPKSTLFMLVCAWMGTELAKQTYREAIARGYRFFSFGDAMFLTRRGGSIE